MHRSWTKLIRVSRSWKNMTRWWQTRLNPPQSQPSHPRSNPWRSKRSFGIPRLSRRTKRKIFSTLRFDVLAQLANIPARITLYKLLKLTKSTREALREALADAEVFMAQILAEPQEEDKEDCLHSSQHTPCITFMSDHMQVKEKHDRPLYFTEYIGSSEVSCIQVDPGSALSIMPCVVM